MKPSAERRKSVNAQAHAEVYTRNGAAYSPSLNPHPAGFKVHELFERAYRKHYATYWHCEDLLDVLGGRPAK